MVASVSKSALRRRATPGRKFSVSTSAAATRRCRVATPPGCLRSSATLRLLRLTARNACSPIPGRVWSPVPGGSTLTTSAPMSPSTCPQNGPAITWQSSMTRTPSSAPFTAPPQERPNEGGCRVHSTSEALQRRADAIADRVAGELEPHLHATEGAGEHQVVEVAEMPDPEDLVGQLAEPRPE